MTMCSWLLAIVLLGSLSSPVALAFFMPSLPGNIQNDHTLFYVGENITLHCYRTDGVFAPNHTFRIENGGEVPSQYVTKVNDTYIRMDRPATAEDPKTLDITCADSEKKFIAEKEVYTEYRPQKVQNLTVVYYDRTRACFSWNLGLDGTDEYKFRPDTQNQNKPTTVVTASYSTNGMDWTECSYSVTASDPCHPVDSATSHTSCQIDPFRSALEFTFQVLVHNTVRNTLESTTFSISNINDYEKPKAVESLSVTVVNSTCASVSWHIGRSELSAEVKYWHQGSSGNRTKKVRDNETSTLICDLHPAYSYNFEVRAVPRAVHGYPSDPEKTTVKMPEDAPASGPGISRGSYYRGPCRTEYQDLYVYFQPVAEEDMNGVITDYVIEYKGKDLDDKDSKTPSGSFHFRRSIFCGSAVDVTLYARTSVGWSPPTHLSIPASEEMAMLADRVLSLDLQVELKNSTQVIMRWKPVPHSWHDTLVLFYCYQTRGPDIGCKYPLEHVEVNAGEGRQVLNAAEGRAFENGRYGLAAVDQAGRGTGIAFTSCVFTVTNDPGTAPRNPAAIEQVQAITLKWGATRCNGVRIVWGYIIEVCPAEDESHCNTIYVDDGSTSFKKLEDLRVGTKYSLRVRANTSSSSPLTPFTAPVYGTPQPSGLSVAEIMGIILGTLVGVTVLGCVLFCVRRYRRQKAKMDVSLTPTPRNRANHSDEKPPLPMRNWNNNQVATTESSGSLSPRQESDDSGYNGQSSLEENRGEEKSGPDNLLTLTPAGNPAYMRVGNSAQPASGDGVISAQATNLTVGFVSRVSSSQGRVQSPADCLHTVGDAKAETDFRSNTDVASSAQRSVNSPPTLQSSAVSDDAEQNQVATQSDHMDGPWAASDEPAVEAESEEISSDQKSSTGDYVRCEKLPLARTTESSFQPDGCQHSVPSDGESINDLGLFNGGSEAPPPADPAGIAEDGSPLSRACSNYVSNGCPRDQPVAHSMNSPYISNGCDRGPADGATADASCVGADEQDDDDCDDEDEDQPEMNQENATYIRAVAPISCDTHLLPSAAEEPQHTELLHTKPTFQQVVGSNMNPSYITVPVQTGSHAVKPADETTDKKSSNGYLPHSALPTAGAAREPTSPARKVDGRGYVQWTNNPVRDEAMEEAAEEESARHLHNHREEESPDQNKGDSHSTKPAHGLKRSDSGFSEHSGDGSPVPASPLLDPVPEKNDRRILSPDKA